MTEENDEAGVTIKFEWKYDEYGRAWAAAAYRKVPGFDLWLTIPRSQRPENLT